MNKETKIDYLKEIQTADYTNNIAVESGRCMKCDKEFLINSKVFVSKLENYYCNYKCFAPQYFRK